MDFAVPRSSSNEPDRFVCILTDLFAAGNPVSRSGSARGRKASVLRDHFPNYGEDERK